jgi:uncharacterized protein YjiS (DUF1127 family)
MAFPASSQGMLFRPVISAFAALKAIGVALSRRRVLGELGQLDDRMLRDIGITRHDVVSAMAEPLFRDPTVQLVNRAKETRAATRATARDRLAVAALLNTVAPSSRAA